MRTRILLLATLLALPSTLFAQVSQVPRGNALRPDLDQVKRHYNAGWDLMRSEDWEGATHEFQRVIDIDPTFANAYYSLGRAHMGLRQYPKAIDAYIRCREVYSAQGAQIFANQLNGKTKLEDQISELQMALQQAQQAKQTNTSTQSLYIRELQGKIAYLQSARDRNQNVTMDTSVPFFVPMSLGAAYFKSGKYEAAEQEYKTALEENSSSGETHSNLAVLYMITGRLREAETEVKAAEKTGFKVNGQFKDDLAARLKTQSASAK